MVNNEISMPASPEQRLQDRYFKKKDGSWQMVHPECTFELPIDQRRAIFEEFVVEEKGFRACCFSDTGLIEQLPCALCGQIGKRGLFRIRRNYIGKSYKADKGETAN